MEKLPKLSKEFAKNLWIRAQKLDQKCPFGKSSSAVAAAVSHLGYVQIDTINVIERCHHHILYNRIPQYKRSDLIAAQSHDKSIFEYWTHALSYVPTDDFKFFVPQMKNVNVGPGYWFGAVTKADYAKVKSLLKDGPVSIRDIKDDVLKAKEHDWDSQKPSKRALQLGFHKGDFVISGRQGMLKIYDLTLRHFGWERLPPAVTEKQYCDYIIDRALRAQAVVSVGSICHLDAKRKKAVELNLQSRQKRGELVAVQLEGSPTLHWLTPENLVADVETGVHTHILSPFDPLVIQRKRLKLFFDYDHLFEAYLPQNKRKFGYFSLPVLHGNEIIALLDLKTDRDGKRLLIQNWIHLKKGNIKGEKKIIESELHRFEKFQLAKD